MGNVPEFQGKVIAELQGIGRDLHDLKSEQRRQGEVIAGWSGRCAENRMALKKEIQDERPRNGNGKKRVGLWIAGASLFFASIGGIGYLLSAMVKVVRVLAEIAPQ